MFHLITHAFFKALLFLGAGSVIHAMSDEQDMRKMGGIWRMIPITYAMMWIGTLALAGIPFFAGYYSKDMILEVGLGARIPASASMPSGSASLAALLTAFYSWRLIFLTFHGKPRADHHVMEHVHESPRGHAGPAVRAGGRRGRSPAGRATNWFVGDDLERLLGRRDLHAAEHDTRWRRRTTSPLLGQARCRCVVGVIGIALAYLFYMLMPRPAGADRRAALAGLYRFLLNKWYFDELYDRLVRPAGLASGPGLWKGGDGAIIDGVGPDGIAAATARRRLARRRRLQTGYVYHYAFAMLIGVVALVTWYLFGDRRGETDHGRLAASSRW